MPALTALVAVALLTLGLAACKTTVVDPTKAFQRSQFQQANGL